MRRIGLDVDGQATYPEFCKYLLPLTEEYASILNKRVPNYLERRSCQVSILNYS